MEGTTTMVGVEEDIAGMVTVVADVTIMEGAGVAAEATVYKQAHEAQTHN